MAATVDQDLKSIKVMLEALLMTIGEDPLIAWVSEVAVGKNSGGAYISMYQTLSGDGIHPKMRFCTCYDQDWGKLPKEVAEKAKALLPKARESRSVNERAEDRKEGLAWEIDPIKVVRYRFGNGDDKTLWRFFGYTAVYKKPVQAPAVATPAPTPPAATPQPEPVAKPTPPTPPAVVEKEAPTFLNRDSALQYGVDQGAYVDLTQALDAYEKLKKRIKITPLTPDVVFRDWIAEVKTTKQAKDSGALVDMPY